jgi:hypothetical protein
MSPRFLPLFPPCSFLAALVTVCQISQLLGSVYLVDKPLFVGNIVSPSAYLLVPS